MNLNRILYQAEISFWAKVIPWMSTSPTPQSVWKKVVNRLSEYTRDIELVPALIGCLAGALTGFILGMITALIMP